MIRVIKDVGCDCRGSGYCQRCYVCSVDLDDLAKLLEFLGYDMDKTDLERYQVRGAYVVNKKKLTEFGDWQFNKAVEDLLG